MSPLNDLPILPPELPRDTRPRLLVVDDQPINVRVLHQIFQADADVLMATSGLQALEVAEREQPDLILLDVMMPELDGLEVCRRLRAIPALASTPVIFVTGQTTAEEETAALEAGGVDFISKPVNPAVVRARVRTHLLLREQARRLEAMAFVDGLTGVNNRRYLDLRLKHEWRVAQRDQTPLAIILIDVDHFKAYNDHHGHPDGDTALRWVAEQLQSTLRRPGDCVARYGGEEFVCLLPRTSLAEALSTSERLRKTIAEGRHPHGASPVAPYLTISAGVAAQVPGPDERPESLLDAADQRLYQAKRGGRDRVCPSSEAPADSEHVPREA
jgi:diguanylate cyclase (GGDEF)-like protein